MENKGKKKQKVVKDTATRWLMDDEFNMLLYRMVDIAEENRKLPGEITTYLFAGVIDLLQVICKVVKEVRVAVTPLKTTKKKAIRKSEARPLTIDFQKLQLQQSIAEFRSHLQH